MLMRTCDLLGRELGLSIVIGEICDGQTDMYWARPHDLIRDVHLHKSNTILSVTLPAHISTPKATRHDVISSPGQSMMSS